MDLMGLVPNKGKNIWDLSGFPSWIACVPMTDLEVSENTWEMFKLIYMSGDNTILWSVGFRATARMRTSTSFMASLM